MHCTEPTDFVASLAAELKVPGVTEKVSRVSPGNIVGGGTMGPSARITGCGPLGGLQKVRGDELGRPGASQDGWVSSPLEAGAWEQLLTLPG